MAQDGIHLPTKEFRDNYSDIFRKKEKPIKKKSKIKEEWKEI